MIDAHHHLWDPARGDYGWMPANDPILSRPYTVADMRAVFAANGVRQSVLVQAAPTVAETDYLLSLADSAPEIAAVVGWMNFEQPDDRRALDRLAKHPKFRAVRPMVQDIPDDDWVLSATLDWAFSALVEMNIGFDALGFPRHAARFLQIAQRYPKLSVVLDHCLKPQIAGGDFDGWAREMELLATQTSACCKLSGLVTEPGGAGGTSALKPYVDHVLAVFGPDRVMWGSDWPVCRLAEEYGDWLRSARKLTEHLDDAAITAVFAGTARTFYRLGKDPVA
jgi:L-fuconolactonase